MSTGTVDHGCDGASYRHEALFYSNFEGFVDGTLPFIRDAVAGRFAGLDLRVTPGGASSGARDPVRKLSGKARDCYACLFSCNSRGGCEECEGRGVLVTEVSYMDPIRTRCETCEGRRFKASVLAHTLRGKSIVDVLDLSAEQALEFFTERPVRGKLEALVETGLGYLGLGQTLSTLSGGERQRIKLADQLSGKGNVYLLDEPTSGLHMSDIDMLLDLLNGIVDRGNTVVVIEHNLAVVEQADWIIDLGPEGGKAGGEIVFTGVPEKLLAAENSLTGRYLQRYQQAG